MPKAFQENLYSLEELRQELVDLHDAGQSVRELSEQLCMSPTFLSFVMNGKCKVSERLANALGYAKIEGFVKKPEGA